MSSLRFMPSPAPSSRGQQVGPACPVPDAKDAVWSSGRGKACPHLLEEPGAVKMGVGPPGREASADWVAGTAS